jgi:hypothetical protein
MVTVVMGPPAAGKSTYVQAHAKPGDVVIDLDLIARALTCGDGDTHRHPEVVQRVAHRARRAAVREALKLSTRADVWIVHTQPDADTVAEYERHGARMVTVDPGREVVLARIDEQRPPEMRAAVMRWYSGRTVDAVSAQASRQW